MAKIKKAKGEYFLECGKDVSQTVKNVSTSIIPGIGYQSEVRAINLAREKRTYHFPIYEKKQNRLIQFGYAVAS